MTEGKKISMSVVRRLPRYYRYLYELKSNGIYRISSQALAEKIGTSASQIRQDLNCFGGFGQQGFGYDVEKLYEEIGTILGLNHPFSAVLLGAGNLGRAIINHISFLRNGFRLIAVFDNDPQIIGSTINDMTVIGAAELEAFCTEHKVDAAFLCLPKESADQAIDILYRCGVRGYWNFSHYNVVLRYPDVIAENVHLGDSLMTLCCQMSDFGSHGEADPPTAAMSDFPPNEADT